MSWLQQRTSWLVLVIIHVGFSLEALPSAAEIWKDAGQLSEQPVWPAAERTDWLLDGSAYVAGVYRGSDARELVLSNGLVRRVFRLAPNAATVALDCLVTDESLLRSVRSEANVTLDGRLYPVGGLAGQPNQAYLLPEWLDTMTDPVAAMKFDGFEVSTPQAPFAWKRVRHHAPAVQWPAAGVHLRLDFRLPSATVESGASANTIAHHAALRVSVHYELYDGVPVFCKWITIHNPADNGKATVVDHFTAETLAVVEAVNWVETRDGVAIPKPDRIHAETDFAFGGFNPENANRHVVHWRPDPEYQTQVNYLLQTPCLLVIEPTYGPAQTIPPGQTFTSFRSYELIHDSSDRERRGLAMRRMYRTIAPWVTENPLMHHMRVADPERVRHAIDQAAEVGFEMVILSFGSGFDMENDSPEYVNRWRAIADHARRQNVEIGGYSLLSSRKIGGGNDIVSPAGQQPTHGNCPALTSEWGQRYFDKLYRFFPATGFTMLEHDGSYPGDVDVTARPPFQKGEADSRWAQWRVIQKFYQWCRANGIYLNIPDYYFLSGANKCGMGYREVNWSLPRDMQVIHTRQNIFDGTWQKTPSMGWMFVPLSQYHGGGAAATIEPLAEHLPHYERMLQANLGFGVQACYRGPRLYDTEQTRQLVTQQVAWFKKYRTILESDVVHGRRADGRDLDWMLHVNPGDSPAGMLIVHNPLDRAIEKTLRLDLYYTGLKKSAELSRFDQVPQRHALIDSRYALVTVEVPAHGMTWYVVRP